LIEENELDVGSVVNSIQHTLALYSHHHHRLGISTFLYVHGANERRGGNSCDKATFLFYMFGFLFFLIGNLCVCVRAGLGENHLLDSVGLGTCFSRDSGRFWGVFNRCDR
jgi:hypothetical protein